jgi:hypothetical protein
MKMEKPNKDDDVREQREKIRQLVERRRVY